MTLTTRITALAGIVALAAALTGCTASTATQESTIATGEAAKTAVCANGNGAVAAVNLGGVATRMIANIVVDTTPESDAIHPIAVAAAANPDDAQVRDQLAAWVTDLCGAE